MSPDAPARLVWATPTAHAAWDPSTPTPDRVAPAEDLLGEATAHTGPLTLVLARDEHHLNLGHPALELVFHHALESAEPRLAMRIQNTTGVEAADPYTAWAGQWVRLTLPDGHSLQGVLTARVPEAPEHLVALYNRGLEVLVRRRNIVQIIHIPDPSDGAQEGP